MLNLVIEYDVNGDGTIDFDEFMEMMKKQAEHQVNFFGSNDSSICSKDRPSDSNSAFSLAGHVRPGIPYPEGSSFFLLTRILSCLYPIGGYIRPSTKHPLAGYPDGILSGQSQIYFHDNFHFRQCV